MSRFGSAPAGQGFAAGSFGTPQGAAPPQLSGVGGGLFAHMQPGAPVEVPGFFLADCSGGLRDLRAPAPAVPTPQDDNIAPAEGDDTSAPNAVTASRLNRIVCVSSANVGYSEAAKDREMLPSALEYEAIVEEGNGTNEFALTLKITLEYESAFPKEGMVVWLKKHQQLICDETEAELMLVETVFQDYVHGRWVTITTDVRYAEEAEAMVQAVITTDSGQTAGRVKTEGSMEDAKLGPVGERGRIVLTYRCSQLYSYAEMALGGASAGSRSLVPLALQLPWAALDNPGNRCAVKAAVRAPAGASLLDPQANVLAYRDLQQSLQGGSFGESQVVIVLGSDASTVAAAPTWCFERKSLPPKPTLVLAWLSIPDADDGWEQLQGALPKATRATLLKATPEDIRLLGVFIPGKQEAHLVRCQIETEAPQRSPNSVRVHTDITISDASGSTGMTHGRSGQSALVGTTRELLNQYEERRLLKRLEAIPKLREAGVLLENDIWNQIFVIFDHGIRKEFGIESSVGQLDAATVANLLRALAGSDATSESALQQAGKSVLLDKWRQALNNLRTTTPGGATSFVEGTKRAKQRYLEEVANKHRGKACTTYVNFDTDGGNNCGPCYAAISALVVEADVVQGHVTGVGAWVDQDCASRVAKLLKGTASLTLSFPEQAEADKMFRQDLSRWIKVLRTTPVNVTICAGSVTWAACHGERHENGVDVLFAAGAGLKFGQPDVSEPTFTKAALGGLQAGESTTLYLLSRWSMEQLAATLRIEVEGVQARVSVGAEPLKGVALGHHWLSLFGGQGSDDTTTNSAVLCTRLRHRLEDDISFAWNLPTKSGSTAAVGRAKTEQRPPVPKAKQPEEPKVPEIRQEPANRGCPLHVGDVRFGGGQVGCPAPMMGFGAACDSGSSEEKGRRHHRHRFLGAAAAPVAALPPFPQVQAFAGPHATSQWGGGVFGFSASVGSAPQQRMRMMSGAAPEKKKSLSASQGKGGGREFFFGGGGEEDAVGSKLPTPSQLLNVSGFMRCGAVETSREAVVRALLAMKYMADQAVLIVPPQQKGHQLNEDPLVADLLGDLLGPSLGGGAVAQGTATHMGFVCDGSGANPITGVRYKATSSKDMDITEACRRQGRYPMGGAGWRDIADPATALRVALAAVLGWWQVIWPTRADLFGQGFPNLQTLSVAELAHAVKSLPAEV